MEHYSAVQRNEALTHDMTCMNLENTLRSKISQTHEDKHGVVPPMRHLVKSSSHTMKVGRGCWELGRPDRDLLWIGTGLQFGKIGSSKDGRGNGCTTMWMHLKHWTVHLGTIKMVDSVTYIYKNKTNPTGISPEGQFLTQQEHQNKHL